MSKVICATPGTWVGLAWAAAILGAAIFQLSKGETADEQQSQLLVRIHKGSGKTWLLYFAVKDVDADIYSVWGEGVFFSLNL